MSHGVVTITTAATLIVAGNTRRQSIVITNAGGTVYIGPDVSISTKQSPHIVSNGTYTEDSGGQNLYLGDYYGTCTSGTSTVYWWERTRW